MEDNKSKKKKDLILSGIIVIMPLFAWFILKKPDFESLFPLVCVSAITILRVASTYYIKSEKWKKILKGCMIVIAAVAVAILIANIIMRSV